MVQTDNKDPDIVEQALIKVAQALVGGDGQPPRELTPADTQAVTQGVMLCLSHKNSRVQTAAVNWCGRPAPPRPLRRPRRRRELGHPVAHPPPAARSVAPFAAKLVDKSAIVPIAEQLCQTLAAEPGEARETANLGLRGLLSDNGLTDAGTAQPVVDVLVPSLAQGVRVSDKHALTHLHTLLEKFGSLCAAQHSTLQTDLYSLSAPAPSPRPSDQAATTR